MERMRVWVILGGLSAEREVAAESGRAVANALREKGHVVLSYELADGRFLREGSSPELPGQLAEFFAMQEIARLDPSRVGSGDATGGTSTASIASTASGVSASSGSEEQTWAERLLHTGRRMRGQIDVAFLALHGGGGEDGTVQTLLETIGVPYTGSGPTASAIAMDKVLTKRLMLALEIPTPRWLTMAPLRAGDAVPGLPWEPPLVVKPVAEGSSLGISIVRAAPEWERALLAASHVEAASRGQNRDLLIEEYIPGRELTVGILGGSALPVLEIVPKDGFYDYGNKYTAGASEYRVPADIPAPLTASLADQSERLYAALGCRGMARVDFRLSPAGEAYCLELNTIPGLTSTSLVPKAAAATGLDFGGLLERVCRDSR